MRFNPVKFQMSRDRSQKLLGWLRWVLVQESYASKTFRIIFGLGTSCGGCGLENLHNTDLTVAKTLQRMLWHRAHFLRNIQGRLQKPLKAQGHPSTNGEPKRSSLDILNSSIKNKIIAKDRSSICIHLEFQITRITASLGAWEQKKMGQIFEGN